MDEKSEKAISITKPHHTNLFSEKIKLAFSAIDLLSIVFTLFQPLKMES